MKKPNLKVVDPVQKQPEPLGQAGQSLWDDIVTQYEVPPGSLHLLRLACQSLDRAERLRERIDAEGETVQTPSGMKEQPCLKGELSNRAFVSRSLARLLPSEKKPVGRPAVPTTWRGPNR